MSYYLFLDDMRDPPEVKWVNLPQIPFKEWVIARNGVEFIQIIKEKGVPKFVSFDHDLEEEHYLPEVKEDNYTLATGYECAIGLYYFCLYSGIKFPQYTVHSTNVSGNLKIRNFLEKKLI
jgi:hypothetical protein